MKRVIRTFIIAGMLTIPVLLTAQVPPHPNGGGGPGGGNTPVGGGAPLDGGMSIMLIMAGLYGSGKLYKTRFTQ